MATPWYGDRYGDRYGYGDRLRVRQSLCRCHARRGDWPNAIVGVSALSANTATLPTTCGKSPMVLPVPDSVLRATYRNSSGCCAEGHYEEYETWVPDTYESANGETIKGIK